MDTIGPLTKTVKDSAYLLQSIVGIDAHDNYTSAIPDNANTDFLGACNLSALQGARLGVPHNVINLMSDSTTASTIAAFNAALPLLRSSGATILETDFPSAQDFLADDLLSLKIMAADFVVGIEKYLAQLTHNPHNITTLAELRDWTRKYPLEGYPAKSTGVWDFALRNANNTSPAFWEAYQRGLYYDNEGGLLGTIKRYRLDAVLLPSQFAWSYAAVAGAPVVSIPLGAMPADQPVVSDGDGLVASAPNIP
jgi:amidase